MNAYVMAAVWVPQKGHLFVCVVKQKKKGEAKENMTMEERTRVSSIHHVDYSRICLSACRSDVSQVVAVPSAMAL